MLQVCRIVEGVVKRRTGGGGAVAISKRDSVLDRIRFN